ncbi:MAG: ABC transporter substrate-binding protein [Chloroflexi bacterium]|nr:ABC transporter substrate-binding protein [Chloroflexota bacterium]
MFTCLLFSACVSSTKPSIKIALVGPFEGRYRDVGIEVIYAMRLAIREANAQGGVGGYTVELMGFDDSGDPDQAMMQAKKVATDSQVVAAVGNWLPSTTQAAAPVYDRVGIPFVAMSSANDLPSSSFRLWNRESTCPSPCITLDEWFITRQLLITNYFIAPAPLPQDSSDPSFADRYKKISQGVEPKFLATLTYDATKIILAAIERDVKANGKPTRLGLAAALAQTNYNGLSGRITFDAKQNWNEGKGWVYKWEEGKLKK